MCLHFHIINVLPATRLYKEIKSMDRFGGRGTFFAFIYFFLSSPKRLRSPSTKSERSLGTGSLELRVKALLETVSKHKPKKENHEHKGGRRNFSALGCFLWISRSLLSQTQTSSLSVVTSNSSSAFLLCLQSKYVAFCSAAKGLYALAIIKQELDPLPFLSHSQTTAALPTTQASKSGL